MSDPSDQQPPNLAVAGKGDDVCPTCGGSGRQGDETCPECGGKGTVEVEIAGG